MDIKTLADKWGKIIFALIILTLTVGLISDIVTVLDGTQTYKSIFDNDPLPTASGLYPMTYTVRAAAIAVAEGMVGGSMAAIYNIFNR